MSEIDEEVDSRNDLLPVTLPSGAIFYVHETEVSYIIERTQKYMSDNKFINVSDLQDLDRMLTFELLSYRWANWISQQVDYWSDPVDLDKLQKALNDVSKELRLIKKSIGVDKETREKQRGEDSVESYLASLRQRAKEFGITREKQLDQALELFNQLKSHVVLYNNCTEQERQEQDITIEKIFDWIVNTAIPKYDEIDLHFRSNSQKYWIKKV